MPLLIHLHCAYHQLQLNGHEVQVYANRGTTAAFANLLCNVWGGQDNYPEARTFQNLQQTNDAAQLTTYLAHAPIVFLAGCEHAAEADFLITFKQLILNPDTHLKNFLPTALEFLACAQIKSCELIPL